MTDAPEWLVNEDGRVIAVRFDQARSPADAYRRVVEDVGHDWVLEDLPIEWNEDESDYRYNVGALRALVSSVQVGWNRPWNQEQDGDLDYMWGKDTWFWCKENHPDAVKYWDLNND